MIKEHNVLRTQHCIELKKYMNIYRMFLSDDAKFQINTNITKRAIIKTLIDEGDNALCKSLSHNHNEAYVAHFRMIGS